VTILHSLDAEQRVPSVVTIGTFDGVHRGHQLLVSTAIARARELGVQSVVLTFEPIPAMVLRPDKFKGRICSPEEKIRLLVETGVDVVSALSFDRAFSLQTPEEFLARVEAAFDVREIMVGEAFALGKDRSGNVEVLREIGQSMGFEVRALQRLTDGDDVISSSAVREAIIQGDVTRATRLLGRRFHVDGVVIHGSHFGRKIGYPTANIEPPVDQVPLADGIYASYCYLPDEERAHPAMTYVGTRPTVNSGPRNIETNVLDFEGDLYGRRLRVELVERLRPDEQFPTLEAMIEQLGRDEARTRTVLTGHPAV
jgi:riboflavin kinase/FMN adenylyltransferase